MFKVYLNLKNFLNCYRLFRNCTRMHIFQEYCQESFSLAEYVKLVSQIINNMLFKKINGFFNPISRKAGGSTTLLIKLARSLDDTT